MMIVQHSEYTKRYRNVHFNMVNFMSHELYFNVKHYNFLKSIVYPKWKDRWKIRDCDYEGFPIIKKWNNLVPPNPTWLIENFIYSVAFGRLREKSCGMVFTAGQEKSESLHGPLLRAKECG